MRRPPQRGRSVASSDAHAAARPLTAEQNLTAGVVLRRRRLRQHGAGAARRAPDQRGLPRKEKGPRIVQGGGGGRGGLNELNRLVTWMKLVQEREGNEGEAGKLDIRKGSEPDGFRLYCRSM